MDIDADKVLAALEQLEAERQRRIDTGAVVTVPLVLVGESVEDAKAQAESAKAFKTEELRAAGERRPIHFDVTLVVTGPDADDDECPTAAPDDPGQGGEAIAKEQRALGELVASGAANLSVPSLPAIPP